MCDKLLAIMARLVLFTLAILAAGGFAEPGKKALPQKIGKFFFLAFAHFFFNNLIRTYIHGLAIGFQYRGRQIFK